MQAAVYVGACLYQLGDPEGATESAERGFTMAAALGAIDLQVGASNILGEICQWALSDYRRAAQWLSGSVKTLTGPHLQIHMGALVSSVSTRGNLAWCLAELGNYAEMQVHGTEALRLAEAVDHPYSLARACVSVGHARLRQGDLAQAVPLLERGMALSETMSFTTTIRLCSGRLGVAYALAGRLTEALPRLEQAHAFLRALRQPILYPLYAIWLAEGYLLAHRATDALPLVQRALEVGQIFKQRGYQAEALRLLGTLAAQRHPVETTLAEDCYQRAGALAKEAGMRPLLALTARPRSPRARSAASAPATRETIFSRVMVAPPR